MKPPSFVSSCALPLLLLAAGRSGAQQDPVRPYPLPDGHLKSTAILDHASYLGGFDDPQWYLDNIPFVDLPDKEAQDVYYYRTSVIKRHLKYVHEGHGWMFTEFIHPVSWASKFQTIPDSAGHHIVEARWLRDPAYVKDLITAYTRAGVEALSGITYTHYVQRAILEHAHVTGDREFLTSQLDGMIASFNLWDVQFDNSTGLYHRVPLSDAQEYSLPGYVVGGPDGGPMQEWIDPANDYTTIFLGPETYRPSHNSYMVANARAIAEVARLAGNTPVASEWAARAAKLEQDMHDLLWDADQNYWIDVVWQTNLRITGRELIGFFPYRFDIENTDDAIRGLEATLDAEGFLTEFGPTTLEQRNPYYTALKNMTNCCVWNGQSWPFSTSVYLGTLAKIARANRSDVITPEFFQQEFRKYVVTNYKGGVPYTAESHYPTLDAWSGDTANHSEHYFHSTYLDNVFTNLLGIVPALDDRLELQPLIPENWTYFTVENLPYHGSLLSLLWDQDGTHYTTTNHSAGLSVFMNSILIHTQPTLAATNITLANSTAAVRALATSPRHANILSNPNSPHGLPSVTADYRWSTNGDISAYEAWKLNDGLVWFDATPDNRWTNNQSYSPYATINVTLPRARHLTAISLAVLDDRAEGGAIACPRAVDVVDAASGALLARRDPWPACAPNALNTIAFDAAAAGDVRTDRLALRLTNQIPFAVALTEVQLWVPEERAARRYAAADGLLGAWIGFFQGRAAGTNASVEDGGVRLGAGGWVEVAGVEGGGVGRVAVVGREGRVRVVANWLPGKGNQTVVLDGREAVVEVELLDGRNVITVFQEEGSPWVDAVVVG
ncbi:uncharacterized protein K452DRAFT_262464 [Neofusicoccum parvum]|uniref:Uncharacterized protein K452DRAFT_262464 n=1 Tax=Neofusicoccum parvum TaxID=310453 RepID=A0ACB5RYA9_9PEZI|nr:uncharacterized protein K452DRAFT_262464 [Neofusicoccum parvum]